MISALGQGLSLTALLCAVAGCGVAFQAGRTRSPRLWAATTWLATGFSVAMILANLLMVYALLKRDFSVSYVAEVGSWSTPNPIAAISLWASLNGSILFWGGVLGVYVLTLTWRYQTRYREYMPYTLHVLLGVSIFFAALLAGVADPFAATPLPIPTDGPGPNPLLQNHILMAVHPPLLYLGFVGLSVPFSMAAASLYAGRLEAGWIAPLRRWLLVPWAFLTVAIMLGGWWSYEVLGWGGYWAWDPVENASFHPWLTATAALHSAMLLQRKGLGRSWTLVLIFATYLLTIVGTFMTRSGVFNSVHSFTQSDIGPIFLGFIAVIGVFSVGLMAFRLHLLEGDSEDTKSALPLLSREMSLILQNFLFALFTFVVLLGTLYPLIMEAYDGRRLSVGEPFFDRLTLPLGVLIVFLMGVGPALPWGQAKGFGRLFAPAVGGLALAGIAVAFGFDKPGTVAALAACGFAATANLAEWVIAGQARQKAKKEALPLATFNALTRMRRRVGGHVAHLGVVICVIGIALSKGYKTERDLVLKPGDTALFSGYELRFEGTKTLAESHRDRQVAYVAVSKNGASPYVMEPALNTYKRMREPIGTPAVSTGIKGDLYLSLMQVAPQGEWVSMRVMYMPGVPWIWIAVLIMAAGGLISAWPSRASALAGAAAAKPEPAA